MNYQSFKSLFNGWLKCAFAGVIAWAVITEYFCIRSLIIDWQQHGQINRWTLFVGFALAALTAVTVAVRARFK